MDGRPFVMLPPHLYSCVYIVCLTDSIFANSYLHGDDSEDSEFQNKRQIRVSLLFRPCPKSHFQGKHNMYHPRLTRLEHAIWSCCFPLMWSEVERNDVWQDSMFFTVATSVKIRSLVCLLRRIPTKPRPVAAFLPTNQSPWCKQEKPSRYRSLPRLGRAVKFAMKCGVLVLFLFVVVIGVVNCCLVDPCDEDGSYLLSSICFSGPVFSMSTPRFSLASFSCSWWFVIAPTPCNSHAILVVGSEHVQNSISARQKLTTYLQHFSVHLDWCQLSALHRYSTEIRYGELACPERVLNISLISLLRNGLIFVPLRMSVFGSRWVRSGIGALAVLEVDSEGWFMKPTTTLGIENLSPRFLNLLIWLPFWSTKFWRGNKT